MSEILNIMSDNLEQVMIGSKHIYHLRSSISDLSNIGEWKLSAENKDMIKQNFILIEKKARAFENELACFILQQFREFDEKFVNQLDEIAIKSVKRRMRSIQEYVKELFIRTMKWGVPSSIQILQQSKNLPTVPERGPGMLEYSTNKQSKLRMTSDKKVNLKLMVKLQNNEIQAYNNSNHEADSSLRNSKVKSAAQICKTENLHMKDKYVERSGSPATNWSPRESKQALKHPTPQINVKISELFTQKPAANTRNKTKPTNKMAARNKILANFRHWNQQRIYQNGDKSI